MMKYANISIENGYALRGDGDLVERIVNIGDDIQLIAIDNLYRIMGISEEDIIRIEYYDLLDYDGEYVILPINFIYFNPFYGERDLILSPKIIPVFLGVHCIDDSFNSREIEYIKKYEPIGCRDEYTMNILRRRGVQAYLQGCLSITLPRRKDGNFSKVYFVDVCDDVINKAPEKIIKDVEFLTHGIYTDWNRKHTESIYNYTYERLNLYKNNAKLVVTSRLHCAAPCIGMGIPTLFVPQDFIGSYSFIEAYTKPYIEKEWDDINWEIESVEIEGIKNNIISNAINRIRKTYEKYSCICELSEYIEKRTKIEYNSPSLVRVIRFVEDKWDKNKEIRYGIWGITQSSDAVCNWIEKEYPNAKLSLVIDDFRKLEFRGIESVTSDVIDGGINIDVIATGNSSSKAAYEKFKDINKLGNLCTIYNAELMNRL